MVFLFCAKIQKVDEKSRVLLKADNHIWKSLDLDGKFDDGM